MTAEKKLVDTIRAQLVELRREIGRVAAESGSTSSPAVKAVQAQIAELTAKLQEAEAAQERIVPKPLNASSTLEALGRIGRNTKKQRDQPVQPELPLDAPAQTLPLFDPEKLELMDDASASTDPAELDPIMQADKWLKHLRELHRDLSEQLIEVNRELARQGDNAGADLRQEAQRLRSKQAEVEAEIEVETKAFKALLQSEKQSASVVVPESDEGSKSGLIRVRHPNRDFFLADLFDYALKDDGASMEAPIFTLATKPDLSIWTWTSKDGNKSIKVAPSVLGRATQFDKDVLIYVVSQLTEALNRGREDAQNRTVRFTVYDYLVTTNRGVGGDDYRRLQEAFERLAGTRITTDIKTGGERVKEGFGIIDSWRIIEKSRDDERMIAVEITLSRWLYNAVQAFEVLTIHPDYFRLRKPLARRLYELARKHCGHQTSWAIGLDLLREKSGSKSTLREFRRAVRAIEADDTLPEYRIVVGHDDKVTFYVRDGARLIRGITKRVSGA